MEGEDRRRFARFNLLVDVAVSKRDATESEKVLSTKNISQGGVCVVSCEEYRIGDLLNVRLRLPDVDGNIDAIGKVVWVKPWETGIGPQSRRFDIGLEFIGVNDSLYAKIHKYLFNKVER
ncbi:MAG: PilZ domain-containing protein [Candidatus Omnitrophica bacterium]|nr:PilZ domain-containing protein [Candidatus Omnitrophota bacterium]